MDKYDYVMAQFSEALADQDALILSINGPLSTKVSREQDPYNWGWRDAFAHAVREVNHLRISGGYPFSTRRNMLKRLVEYFAMRYGRELVLARAKGESVVKIAYVEGKADAFRNWKHSLDYPGQRLSW